MPASVPTELEDPDAVLRALLPKLRGWLVRYLGPSSALDDVTQDALIAVSRAMPRFRADSSFETFAYRIAIRVASRSLQRQSRRQAVLKLVPPAPEQIDLHSQLADRQLLERLYVALDTLPHKLRSVFVLCELEERSPTEAARILELKASTVRSQLRRARNRLALLLKEDEQLLWCEEGP